MRSSWFAAVLAALSFAVRAQTEDPKAKAAALVEQAAPLAAGKEWKQVKPLAEQALGLDPANGRAHELLGLAHKAQKKWASALAELEKAAQNGVDPKAVARPIAECAEKRKDRPRQAKWWLLVAREEKDLSAALKSARNADGAAQVEAYELATQLGRLPKEDLAPFARAELSAGAPQKAAPLFDQAAAAFPGNVPLAIEGARVRLVTKEIAAAEARAHKIYEAHPQEPAVLLLLAEIANAQGDAVSERKILEDLVAAQPKYGPGQLRLGKLLLSQGDKAGARARFAAAVAAAPGDAEAHRLSAELAFDAKDIPAALSEAKAAQKLAPKDPAANLILGRSAYASEDFSTAQTALEAGRRLAGAEALLELGDSYRRGKQYGKARAALGDALKKEAPPVRAHELLGDVALADGKGPEAVKEYAQAAEGRDKEIAFQVKRASAADLAGDRETAAAALDAILAVQPGEPRASVARAKIWRSQGNPLKAAELLEPVAAKDPRDASVQSALADARIESGNFPGAKTAAEAALAADSGNALGHDVLGRVLYHDGKRAQAQPHLERYAASGEALVDLADLQLAAGKRDAAKATAARAKAAKAVRLPVIEARLKAKEDLDAAEKIIAPYLAAHPEDGDGLAAGADIAYDSAQFDKARERFEKAVTKAAITPAALGRLCDLRVKNDAYEPAKQACKDALAGGNDSPAVHASLGLALYKTGDKPGAKAELKIAAAADKKNQDVATHAALGAIALEEGDEKTALSEYDLVLKQKSDNVEANTVTGRLLEKKGNHKEAAVRLGRAFAVRKGDAQLGADLAKAQLGAGSLAGAQKTLSQIRTDELAPEVLHGLKGRVENGLGNYRKAHEEYQKALQAKPGDAELLALDGENYLKLPDYDKAIASLEKAAKADPSRLDVATQLTRLYSETGQTAKAAQTLLRVDELQKKQVEEDRKSLDPKLIRRLAISDDFQNKGKDLSLPGLGVGLRNSVAGDLARSPRIQIVDTKHREAVAKERDRIAQQRDVSQADLDKLAAQEQAPQGVISGIYILDGDTFQLSVEVHDLQHNLLANATETGARKDYGTVEKHVALKVLDRLVDLTPDERAQLQRLEGVGPTLDSFAYASEAQDLAAQGKTREATALYQRARDTDQSNAKALVGLEQSLAEAEKKNQIAIPSPQSSGDFSEVDKEMFRRTLADKLSGLKGLRVIEQSRVKEVDEELDRIMDKDRDNIDPKSVDLQAIGKKLAATVLVRSTMQKDGEHLAFTASLVDITDQKLLLGAAVDGPAAQRQKLQSDLAKEIVRRLRGEPTDEEKAALEATLKEDDYQKKMAELSRLLDKEKREKAEAAALPKPGQTAKPAVATAEPPKAAPAAQKTSIAPESPRSSSSWDFFSASARLSRVSPGDLGSKNMYGLLVTHYAKRSKSLQYALVLDFESSRLANRDSANHTSWYALGVEVGMPLQYKGNGLLLGVTGNLGLAQLQLQLQSSVQSALAVSVEPHAGIEFALGGVGLTGAVGYRLPFFLGSSLDNSSTGLRGPYVQAGIKTESLFSHGSGGGLTYVGYTAHMLVPNGSRIARDYATTSKIGGGALWTHGLAIGRQSENTKAALYLGYGSQSAAGDTLSRMEASVLYVWNAFGPENFFNPFLGLRAGGTLFKSAALSGGSQKLGFLAAPMAGIDLQFARQVTVTVGAGYDAILGSDSFSGDSSLSGYSIDAGATVRF